MGNQLQEPIAITNNVIALVFQTTDIPDAAGTAKSLQATTDDYIMPFAGSVIGIGVVLNGALSTGTVTFNPAINGTGNTTLGTAVLNGTQRNYASIQSRRINFTAGQRVGVVWTKSGTVSPTTTDASIVLFVVLEGMDF